MPHVLLATATLAYCSAGMAYLWYLFDAHGMAARFGRRALLLGLLLHGAGITLRAVAQGFSPAMDVRDGLSLLAWFMGLTFLLLDRRLNLPVLGALTVPLMLVVALPALSVPGRPAVLSPALHTLLLPVHVTVAFLGEAAFGIASLVGVAYLVQERGLKVQHGRSALGARLPSLELMDQLNRRLTLAGFAFFTVTLVSGALFARGVWGRAIDIYEPSELMALVTWLIYGVLLWGRVQAGWRGRRAALLTLVGFAVAMVSFVGLAFCPAGRHGGAFL